MMTTSISSQGSGATGLAGGRRFRVRPAGVMLQSALLLTAVVGGGLGLGTVGSGCAGKPEVKVDPAARLTDTNLDIPSRADLVDRIWEESSRDAAARDQIKRIAWNAGHPGPVRVRALEVLSADPGDPQGADTRALMRLMLPTEGNGLVAQAICERAAAGRWTEFAPALVRRYSRRTDVADDLRPERAALLAIFPGHPLDKTVFEVFAAPAIGDTPERLEWARKARTGAWELLARLDKDGSRRAALLKDAAVAADDPLLATLRVCAADLGALPLTAAQLDWVTTLRSFAAPAPAQAARADDAQDALNKAWWAEARAAVATLSPDRREGWAVRHVEPLRWAVQHRPELVALDRPSLAADLRARFRGRPTFARGSERGPGETFFAAMDRLAWGDLLTVAVIDEALQQAAQGPELARQVDVDRRDTSTEYGGVLEWRDGRFVFTLFPPRPGQRGGDLRFVASDDMLRFGARALAHYHFHANRVDNSEYAGPGPGDLDYANEQGRACVVLTSIDRARLNADYYHAGGVQVDLGEIALK